MAEPFKTSTRFVIYRRWPNAKNYHSTQWHVTDYFPDGRVAWTQPAVFKTLAEAKKALKKLDKSHGVEYSIVEEVRTHTIVG